MRLVADRFIETNRGAVVDLATGSGKIFPDYTFGAHAAEVAVDTETLTPHLLLAPENPDGETGRVKGCCTVLGWADGRTVLYESRGVHGRWVLAWDVTTGTVSRVTQVVGGGQDGSPQPPVLALNVGWRY